MKPTDSPRCCAICGANLPERSGAGRPRVYCSPSCRRTAEFEIRRLGLRLEGIDAVLSSIRIHQERAEETLAFASVAAAVAAYQAEHALLTARLRMLVSGLPDNPGAEPAPSP